MFFVVLQVESNFDIAVAKSIDADNEADIKKVLEV